MNKPKINQEIYVPSAIYLSHGRDDFEGGLCKIIEVAEGISGGEPTFYVRVQERPNHLYSWPYLEEQQEKLKNQYGETRGHPEPDYSIEGNDDSGWQSSTKREKESKGDE